MDPVYLFVVANTVGPSTSVVYSMYLGSTHGVKGAIPYTLGTSLGFTAVLTLSAVLMGLSLELPSSAVFALKLFASLYTAWLACQFLRTAFAPRYTPGKLNVIPQLGLLSGAGQQLVNPRGWTLATVTLVGFADATAAPIMEGLRFSLLYASVGLPTALMWTALGAGGYSWFQKVRRWLGVVCAGLLLISIAAIWKE